MAMARDGANKSANRHLSQRRRLGLSRNWTALQSILEDDAPVKQMLTACHSTLLSLLFDCFFFYDYSLFLNSGREKSAIITIITVIQA